MTPLTAHGAAALADRAEALAFADLYAAAPAALQGRLGLHVRTVADATLLLATGLPDPMFNRALGLGLQVPATHTNVDAIVAAYRTGGIADWWLHWNPHAEPAGWDAQLRARGFTPPRRRSWAKMLRGVADPPRPACPFDVQAVDDAPAAQAVAELVAGVFGMPPALAAWLQALHRRRGWSWYAVRAGGTLAGAGALYVEGELAWLGMSAVAVPYRGRGAQAALMARRIADAGAAGARHVVTETGEPVADEPNPSLANMRRCGFEQVASRLNLAAPR